MACRDMDECCSPKYLFTSTPVKDPYSTDDEQEPDKILRGICQEIKVSENKADMSLSSKVSSSELRPEQVHFYFNIDFTPISEEIVLIDKSVEDCLVELFKFAPTNNYDAEKSTWRGESMKQITEETSYFSWFRENDDLNWKLGSKEEKEKKQQFFSTLICNGKKHCPDFHRLIVAESTMHLYNEIIEEEDNLIDHEDRMKRHHILTSFMESVALCIAPSNYIQNGKCVQEFDLYVPHHVVSDNSSLLPNGRKILITIRPDGIFTYNRVLKSGVNMKIWAVAVEIYGSSSKAVIKRHSFLPSPCSPVYGFSTINAGQEVLSPQLELPTGDKSKSVKPLKSINKLYYPNYVADVRAYIKNSIPVQCRRFCMNKMAGKHVLQLLSLAKASFKTEEMDDVSVLGIFMVNEYIYFSRLDITKKFFKFLEYDRYIASYEKSNKIYFTQEYKALQQPVVSYSNFRLDATVSNHRLALLLFLDQYMQSVHKKC